MGASLRLAEEGGALVGVMAELMAEDAEGAGGIAEAPGDIDRGLFVHDDGAEGFILALERKLRDEEELLVGGNR